MILRLYSEGLEQPLSVEARLGVKLSEALWLSGKLAPNQLCCGLASCGRCRARFLNHVPEPLPADKKFFSDAELAAGWRLTCGHVTPKAGDCILELELPRRFFAPKDTFGAGAKRLKGMWRGSRGKPVALGIDLGTTSIEWRAIGLDGEHEVLAWGKKPNPQAGAGADVVSRLAHAAEPDGLARLADMAREAVDVIAWDLAGEGMYPKRACLVANSAMTAIFLRKDVSGLCGAPYSLAYKGNEILDFHSAAGNFELVVPPLPAPFVGGDISAGILALVAENTPRPFLLADLGTNAELALLDGQNRLFLASVPAGPAMEGIGPRCGQMAEPDVITAFELLPQGLAANIMEPSGKGCLGISATGYLSLLAILYRLGIMAAPGRLAAAPGAMPLAKKIAADIQGDRLSLPHGLFLCADDIEILLKVKAAFAVALKKLSQAAAMPLDNVELYCLAGALGGHASPGDLETLGFLPPGMGNRVKLVGNSALAGACLMARDPAGLAYAAELCGSAITLNLAEDQDFFSAYIAEMNWGFNV